MVVGDFNGDSRPDLATANSAAGTVSILLAQDDGRLIAAPEVKLNWGAGAMTGGDFNGDGRLDLAVTWGDYTWPVGIVTILLGRGDGRFILAGELEVSASPASMIAGDFNRDGRMDLAVTSLVNGTVSILVGQGNGWFVAGAEMGVGAAPYSLAAGDFNNDGRLDLATANLDSDTVSILLGRGNGRFMAALEVDAGPRPRAVAVGDFNGDGRLDLAVANVFEETVRTLLGRGDGGFDTWDLVWVGWEPTSVVVSDFNGDTRLDLATANLTSESVTMLLGNGDGSFDAVAEVGGGVGLQDVVVGDFNADGRADLVTANGASNTVSILINTSPRMVNNFVTFTPLPATFVTSPDTKGCPAGFAGTFRFSARLTNRPSSPALEDLMVRVTTLTNENLVQNAEGGPAGAGAHVLVPGKQGYADGVLGPKESVEVPFVVCLKKRAPFRLLVDVVEGGGD
jgi:hypothetical protein